MSQTGTHSDKELFLRIAEGDEAAFEQLFTTYAPQLRPIIYQIVQTKAAVQDLLQEVFLQLWLGRHRLPEVEEPRHWIFRITYNCSYRYVKKLLLEKRAQQIIGEAQNIYTNETEETVDFIRTTNLVQQAIAALPSQARKIYQLNRVSGMKPGDIAEQLGISTQSVRNSLTRSGKQIKDYLANHGIEIPLILLLFRLP